MSVALDQPVRLTFSTFSDPAETTPADPTTVAIDVLTPAGVTTTYTWAGAQVIRDSLGVFHLDYTPTAAGHYAYHWTAAGAVTTSQDGSFDVAPKFGAGVVSLADAKAQLNITDSTQDSELLGFVETTTGVIEGIVGPILQRSVTEVHNGGGPFIVLNNPPIIAVTSAIEMVGPTAYTLTEAEINTATGAYSFSIDSYERGVIARRYSGGLVGPFAGGVRNVQVTYVAGRTSVPPPIRMAALLLVEHMWEQTQRGNSSGRPLPTRDETSDIDYGPTKQDRAMALLGAYRKAPALA